MVARGRLVVGGVSGSSYSGSLEMTGAWVAGGAAGAAGLGGGLAATVALERGGDVVALGAGDGERFAVTWLAVVGGGGVPFGATVVDVSPGAAAGRVLATVVVVLTGTEDAGTEATGRVPALTTCGWGRSSSADRLPTATSRAATATPASPAAAARWFRWRLSTDRRIARQRPTAGGAVGGASVGRR